MLRLRYFRPSKKKLGFSFVGHSEVFGKGYPKNYDYVTYLWHLFLWNCVPGVVYDKLGILLSSGEAPKWQKETK